MKCFNRLGVSFPAHTVPHHKMFASTAVNGENKAFAGRLDNRDFAWCGTANDPNPYLEIHFDVPTLIGAVAVQGDPYGWNYVRRFQIAFRTTASSNFTIHNEVKQLNSIQCV